jgi:phenylpropionate dioxygenase-like ring-hydroxylating dioxygenase large terminal subunit
MTVDARVTDLVDSVQYDKGLVNRAIFVDQEVYDLELDRLFANNWLFLAHESQLAHPGDFVTTYMGEDSIIVSRGHDGRVRALLNACRHRGMRVCRSDEGNTSFFQCPYHAWTYSSAGELEGVPKFRLGYAGVLDKKEWGLREVTRVESYRGFLFGNWAADGPSLTDWLGDFTTYFDLVFGRDPAGVEVVPGAHRWTVDTNWKIASENFAADMYHVEHSHARPAELGLMQAVPDQGYQISAGMGFVGHAFTRPVSEDAGGEEPLHAYWTMPNIQTEFLAETRARVAEEKGEALARLIPLGHGALFPTFAFLDLEQFRLMRVHHPQGPDRTLIHQWCVLDASLPEDVKDAVRRQYELTFGPAGLLEQDDGENWRECQNGMRGFIGRQLDSNMMLGLGSERTAAAVVGDENAPGIAGGIWSEGNQRRFYELWQKYMQAASPESISEIPPIRI